jgi:hypothetical protein
MGLLMFIPIANFIALQILAFCEWPSKGAEHPPPNIPHPRRDSSFADKKTCPPQGWTGLIISGVAASIDWPHA